MPNSPVPTLVALLVLAASAVAGPDPAPLETWIRRQTEIRSLEADFIQERRLPSLKQPVTSSGRLALLRPGFLRWELGDPPATVAVADGTSLVLAEIGEKRARKIPADAPEAKRFTMLAGEPFRDLAAFRAAFDLHESRADGDVYQATLRPTDRRLRANVPWVFLTIDQSNNHLRAFELELKDGSRIRSVFSRIRINTEIPAARFHFDLTGYRVR